MRASTTAVLAGGGTTTAGTKKSMCRSAYPREEPHPGIFGDASTGYRFRRAEKEMGLATDSDDGYSPLGFALWLDSCNPDFGMQVGLKPFVMTLVNFAGGVFR
jgi:hypothetical protein